MEEDSDSIDFDFELEQNNSAGKGSAGGGGNGVPHCVPSITMVEIEEPYVGQEFDSEEAGHAFYDNYAKMAGFLIRVSKLSRSKRDGTAIGRAFICNKEGFRLPDKRVKILRQKVDFRTGCKAMISLRKGNAGKWVVTKFVRDHNHPLTLSTPGNPRKENLFAQYPNEHEKIRELTIQVDFWKKRCANYQKQLDSLFEHIEEHNQTLSNKIQHIVDIVKKLDNEDQENRGI